VLCSPATISEGAHAPINAVRPIDPAFIPGALDWRERHQYRALVVDHLGGYRRPVVTFGCGLATASRATNAIPFETRPYLPAMTTFAQSGADMLVARRGAGCYNATERRVVIRQRGGAGANKTLS